MITLTFLCVTLASAQFFSPAGGAEASEKQLANYLISNYEKVGVAGRPVRRWDETVKITIKTVLQSIIDLDGRFLTATVWPAMEWSDPFLTWDSGKFSGQKMIALPAKHFWKPDFVSWKETGQNKVDQVTELDTVNVLVSDTGYVMWVPRLTTRTGCTEDPSQTGKINCTFVFGSWVHNSKEVDFDLQAGKPEMDTSYLKLPPGVEILSNTAEKSARSYPCCPGTTFTSISYNLVFRKWGSCSANSPTCCSSCNIKAN